MTDKNALQEFAEAQAKRTRSDTTTVVTDCMVSTAAGFVGMKSPSDVIYASKVIVPPDDLVSEGNRTPVLFRALVKRAGINRSELARKLGMHVGTIYDWKDDAPQYAVAYVELLIEYNRVRP